MCVLQQGLFGAGVVTIQDSLVSDRACNKLNVQVYWLVVIP